MPREEIRRVESGRGKTYTLEERCVYCVWIVKTGRLHPLTVWWVTDSGYSRRGGDKHGASAACLPSAFSTLPDYSIPPLRQLLRPPPSPPTPSPLTLSVLIPPSFSPPYYLTRSLTLFFALPERRYSTYRPCDNELKILENERDRDSHLT